jgi:glutamate transport system substrate-binding protein
VALGRWRRWITLVSVIAALVLGVVVAVVVVRDTGPPSEDELRREALGGRAQLLIGVKDDTPGVSLRDTKTGTYAGFDIEIAYMIANDLGYDASDVKFLPVETEDRARMQARDTDGQFVTVDLVVATYSMTPAREALPGVRFAGPYLRTEQTVLTLRGHAPVTSLQDLRGKSVCTLATSTSDTAAERAGVQVSAKNEISDCVAGLRDHTYDAVTTDAAILAGFVAQDQGRTFMTHDIGDDTDELWGINCGENQPLQTLVNLYLLRSRTDPSDRRWEAAFDKYLRPEQQYSPTQEVAVDRQPDGPVVQVRHWPWQPARTS